MKPGKYTLLTCGLFGMGRQEITIKGAVTTGGEQVVPFSPKGKRKMYRLGHALDTSRNDLMFCAMLLRGWQHPPLLDRDFRRPDGSTSTLGDGVFRFGQVGHEPAHQQYCLDILTKSAVLWTGPQAQRFALVDVRLDVEDPDYEVDLTQQVQHLVTRYQPGWTSPEPKASPNWSHIAGLKDKHIQQLRQARYDSMVPLVKLFHAAGAGTWLLCHLEEDLDTAWGYADLGYGCVEYGTVSLNELASCPRTMGLGVERDIHIDLSRYPSEAYTGLLSCASIHDGLRDWHARQEVMT